MDIGIIAFLVTVSVMGIGSLSKKKKKDNTKQDFSHLPTPKGRTAEERERKRQLDEDLITMIIPTINNDGK